MKTTYQGGVKIIEDISGEVCHVSFREITCVWFFDPGHAWLQVNIQTLQDFGLTPQDFSEFSRTDGMTYTWRKIVTRESSFGPLATKRS